MGSFVSLPDILLSGFELPITPTSACSSLVVVIAYRGMWLPKSILILVLSPHSATNPKKARIRDSLWIRFFFLFSPDILQSGFLCRVRSYS